MSLSMNNAELIAVTHIHTGNCATVSRCKLSPASDHGRGP